MRWFLGILVLLTTGGLCKDAFAFEYVDQKLSFVNHRYLTARIGMGVHTFVENDYVNGTPGPSFQAALQHTVARGVDIEFVYQFSTFRFESPDPILAGETIETRTGMHQEMLRGVFYLPFTMGQPFVSVGAGLYQFTGLDSKTALDLDLGVFVPVGAGFRAFIAKNNISVQFEYTYQFMFGENQSASTLALLGLSEFKVDAYTLMGSFSFHFF